MNKVSYWLAALVAAWSVTSLSGHGEEKQARELMQKKVTHSHKVLAGIALNDFDQIAKNADELVRISKDIEWKVLKTPKYELYSNEFRRAAEGLRENAKTKNLDGANLAYVDMTLTCVKCQKHVRDVRDARLPGKRGLEGVAA